MLNILSNLADPDAFYAALVEMHRDLDPEQNRIANSALILLLSNHIGDLDVLHEAIARARGIALEG